MRGDMQQADSLFQTILGLQLDSLRTSGVPADDLLTTLGTLAEGDSLRFIPLSEILG